MDEHILWLGAAVIVRSLPIILGLVMIFNAENFSDVHIKVVGGIIGGMGIYNVKSLFSAED
jgi:hypothetical protein